MGKALVGILEVGTQIAAFAFLTPFIGPAAAAAVGVALVSIEASVLGPRPPKPQAVEQAIRQPIPPRISAYGLNRGTTVIVL